MAKWTHSGHIQLDIVTEQLVNFISYHYYIETKDKSNNINDIVTVPEH